MLAVLVAEELVVVLAALVEHTLKVAAEAAVVVELVDILVLAVLVVMAAIIVAALVPSDHLVLVVRVAVAVVVEMVRKVVPGEALESWAKDLAVVEVLVVLG